MDLNTIKPSLYRILGSLSPVILELVDFCDSEGFGDGVGSGGEGNWGNTDDGEAEFVLEDFGFGSAPESPELEEDERAFGVDGVSDLVYR